MKNISLALNAILIVAVAILYYFHFSENNPDEAETSDAVEVAEGEPGIEEVEAIESKIGYLNVDSLQKKYKLYSELINKLKRREKKYEKELTTKSAAFEKKVMEFQKKAPTMTQFEGQTRQKELADEEQSLYKMRDDFAIKFQAEEAKLNDEFQKKVKDYIKKLNEETDYNIIIGSSQMGNVVLDYKEGINITNKIIVGLNEQYNNEKKQEEQKGEK
jgi:outer membrane protein